MPLGFILLKQAMWTAENHDCSQLVPRPASTAIPQELIKTLTHQNRAFQLALEHLQQFYGLSSDKLSKKINGDMKKGLCYGMSLSLLLGKNEPLKFQLLDLIDSYLD